MSEPDDPVREGLGDDEDLYDVATWEKRTWLDGLAVSVYGGLRSASSVVLIALALVLFVGLFGLGLVLVAEEPVLGVFGLVSILPALVLMGYLWYDDPTAREPLDSLSITFLLSVLFATFAALLNTLFQPVFGFLGAFGMVLYFFLIVGPIEETVKWLSVRFHAYGTDSFQSVVDGVVYGAVAGLGFAAIENLLYILQSYQVVDAATAGIRLQVAAETAISRAFVGPGHVLFSAIAGYYLGLAKFNPDNRGPIVVKGLLIAAALHAFYNTVATYGSAIVPFSPPVFVAFVVVFDGLLLVYVLRKVSRYESYHERAKQSQAVAADGPGERHPEE